VDVGTFFKSNPQTAKLMQPTVRALDNPSEDTQTAAVFGIAFCQNRKHSSPPQAFAMGLRVIRPITLNASRSPTPSTFATNLRNCIHKGKQLRHIVSIRSRKRGRQRDALGIREHMVFRSRFAAICGIWTSLRPPKTARTDELSTIARDQSICSAFSRCWSKTRWIFSHTLTCCQSRNRRQQVIPAPHPNSWGKYSQGMPVFSTKRIPVSALRLLKGLRPGYRWRRFFSGGNRGSINSHNSSSKIGFAMVVPPCTAREYSKYG
jgi:hypothetical protein